MIEFGELKVMDGKQTKSYEVSFDLTDPALKMGALITMSQKVALSDLSFSGFVSTTLD